MALVALALAAAGTGCAALVSGGSPSASPSPQIQKGQLSATPSRAAFGSVAVGSKGTQSVVLINQGPGSVKIAAISASGNAFTLNPVSLPVVLAAGTNLSVDATFAPTAAQSATGTMTVTSDALNNPLSVAMSGQGAAVDKLLSATPNQISFGNVFLGKSSSANVTLANPGNAAVTISAISVGNSGFSVTGTAPGTTIAPGQTANLSVSFAPIVVGAASSAIAVTSDASNAVSIALNGTGIQVSSHSVLLNWQIEDGVAWYNVYRQDGAGADFVKINSAPIVPASFEDGEVQAGSTYNYVVTAVSADGTESPQSDPVTSTIPEV